LGGEEVDGDSPALRVGIGVLELSGLDEAEVGVELGLQFFQLGLFVGPMGGVDDGEDAQAGIGFNASGVDLVGVFQAHGVGLVVGEEEKIRLILVMNSGGLLVPMPHPHPSFGHLLLSREKELNSLLISIALFPAGIER